VQTGAPQAQELLELGARIPLLYRTINAGRTAISDLHKGIRKPLAGKRLS
jgi:hypothetical protein